MTLVDIGFQENDNKVLLPGNDIEPVKSIRGRGLHVGEILVLFNVSQV